MSIRFSQLPSITSLNGTMLVPIVDLSGPTSYTATLSSLDSFLNTQLPTASSGTAGLVKVGSGISVAGDGTISIPPSAYGTLGLVKIGSGLGIAMDGTISVGVASSGSAGLVKIGSGISVTMDGTISVNTYNVATNSVAGIVKIGSGISIAVDGTISTGIASNSQLGSVKIGSGIGIAVDGTISVTTISAATTSTSGSVIVPTGSGLKIDGSGNISESIVLHAFSFDANKNLIYSKITDTTINLTSDGVNSPYATTDLGTDQYSYSLDANGNLIATFTS